LIGLSLFVNGLGNNAIIPIANKVQIVYELSPAIVNAPITASFLIYSISNFPANYIIDTRGLRISFLIGSGLFAIGIFLFTLVNISFLFVFLGAIFIALGQPFIVNCPAKVATFWFLSKNVINIFNYNNLENIRNIDYDRIKFSQYWYNFYSSYNFH
jgi:hypothetical protein